MVKLILVSLSLFVLAGCVSENATKTDEVGREVRNLDPVEVDPSSLTMSHINAICGALLYKESVLSVLTSTEYTFSYSQRDCSKTSSAPAPKPVKVMIQDTGSAYIFKPVNGEAFGFSNVETSTSGIMKEICQSRTNGLTNPMQTPAGGLSFSLNPSKNDCKSDSDAICIQIDRGPMIDGRRFAIQTRDWMKIKISGTSRGFFTERKVVSTANCGDGQSMERSASLIK